MNGKMARRLRKMARDEMSSDTNAVDRELVIARVQGHDRIVNEPLSSRAFYAALKNAYKAKKP